MPESLADFVAARPDLSEKEILYAWVSDVTTERPIPLAALTAYLRTAGLLRTLRTVAADPNQPQEVRDGLQDFLDHVNDPRQQTLDTTDPVIAGRTAAILAALGQLVPDGGAAILALGGGPRHGPASLEDVAAARESATRAQAYAALDDAWGVEVYQAGRAEILRRRDAGEPPATIGDVLKFVAAQRTGE